MLFVMQLDGTARKLCPTIYVPNCTWLPKYLLCKGKIRKRLRPTSLSEMPASLFDLSVVKRLVGQVWFCLLCPRAELVVSCLLLLYENVVVVVIESLWIVVLVVANLCTTLGVIELNPWLSSLESCE